MDLSTSLKSDAKFDAAYYDHRYMDISQAYSPTKNTAMESINASILWENSYMNPKNSNKQDVETIYRKSDVIFGDTSVNTEAIYKAKRVTKQKK